MSKKRKKKHAQQMERTSQNISQEKYTPVLKKCKEGSQNYRIMLHLIKYGTITQEEARQKFNCWRLSARIKNLRDRGADIETESVPTKTKLASSAYAKYVLKGVLK